MQEFKNPSGNICVEVAVNSSADVDPENTGFSEEVAGLFDLLDKHTTNVDEAHHDLEEEKASKMRTHSILVAGSFLAVIYLIVKCTPTSFWLAFKSPMVIIQGMLLLVYLVVITYFIIQVYSMKYDFKFLMNPTRESLKNLKKTVHEETKLFKALDGYSVEAISYISARLKYQHEGVSEYKSYLVGAIEKVGIVPGFIATIAAFVGALYGKNWMVLYATSFGIGAIIGVYMAIVPAVLASIRTRKYGFVLEQYLSFREKSNTGSAA